MTGLASSLNVHICIRSGTFIHQEDAAVGQAHMERVRVGLGIDGDARYGELTTCTDATYSDLTAVGNQDAAKELHCQVAGLREVEDELKILPASALCTEQHGLFHSYELSRDLIKGESKVDSRGSKYSMREPIPAGST